uniref:Uncharacterized protein n=1 Tax=Picea glauca TaxID=3330 RepID=A0A117NGN7_PICGL|nr:hypothetical protein ABT39_MTgene6079 [Picea glauca]
METTTELLALSSGIGYSGCPRYLPVLMGTTVLSITPPWQHIERIASDALY